MKKHLKTLLVYVIITIAVSITTPLETSQSTRQLCELLKQKTTQIIQLKQSNEHLLNQLSKITQNYNDLGVVTATLEYYRRAGTLQKWNWLNKNYLLQIWGYCRKWEHLAGDDNAGIDLPKFMMGVIHNESNFNHFPLVNHNADGSDDYGITQVNSKCLPLASLLPKELREKDVRTDVEANIALRYVWIKDRKRMRMSWAIMRPDTGWKLYAELKKIK